MGERVSNQVIKVTNINGSEATLYFWENNVKVFVNLIVSEEAVIEKTPEVKVTASEFDAFMDGEVDLITNTPDETFAQKMMGDGIMINPKDGKVYAPCDASIEFIFPTKHAIGLKSNDGIELLLHIGIDTVKMNGEGFDVKVKEGDRVTKGTLLMEVDLDKVKTMAKSSASVMVFTNLNENNKLEVVKLGNTNHNEKILNLR